MFVVAAEAGSKLACVSYHKLNNKKYKRNSVDFVFLVPYLVNLAHRIGNQSTTTTFMPHELTRTSHSMGAMLVAVT